MVAKTPDRASLDRIDSKKGYVRGNVEFISLMAQYAKNEWSRGDVEKFLDSGQECRLPRLQVGL
jgi:hypothetical protein